MSLARLIITDGRGEFLRQMVESFDWYVPGEIAHTVVVDDSGDPDYNKWIDFTFGGATIVFHERRHGLAQAIRTGWGLLATLDVDFVVHLEDDCVFTTSVSLDEWIHPLTQSPHLAQVCLQRGPDNPDEKAAGGILQMYSRLGATCREYQNDGVTWTEQDRAFSLQPNIYRASLTRIGWPEHGGETEFTDRLRVLDADVSFGYLDGIGAAPRYIHAGYCQRSPGWVL